VIPTAVKPIQRRELPAVVVENVVEGMSLWMRQNLSPWETSGIMGWVVPLHITSSFFLRLPWVNKLDKSKYLVNSWDLFCFSSA
jgi:hypothetical protein